jgi:hypothetical protein
MSLPSPLKPLKPASPSTGLIDGCFDTSLGSEGVSGCSQAGVEGPWDEGGVASATPESAVDAASSSSGECE